MTIDAEYARCRDAANEIETAVNVILQRNLGGGPEMDQFLRDLVGEKLRDIANTHNIDLIATPVGYPR